MPSRNDEPPDLETFEVDFCFTKIRRARVPHVCTSCRQPITPGQAYLHLFARVDGQLVVEKHHGHTAGECFYRQMAEEEALYQKEYARHTRRSA